MLQLCPRQVLVQSDVFCLIWFFISQSTIFQLCWDRSSWVEPVLSKDLYVLLKDTKQWRWWGSNPQPFCLESSTLPLSHYGPNQMCGSGQVVNVNGLWHTNRRIICHSISWPWGKCSNWANKWIQSTVKYSEQITLLSFGVSIQKKIILTYKIMHIKMNHFTRKHTYKDGNNKGQDHPVHRHSLFSTFIIFV